ncbi:hypothetical protein G5V59_14665 [Nocardioides sp. W3-2-3]|uniref:hypothetical protein n=1 Tax=Nocardioides convexus TaxID=2712224 RepID=UPI002418538E|nr:hypothetical protein [Nocardioides convexus]NHA00779.1 hypothetical protein [Nocardioides convexus]
MKPVDNNGDAIAGQGLVTQFDDWGRPTSYSIDNGSGAEITTTTYNASGDVSAVTDPRGTTTYQYDGTDAAGKEEHRGEVTKVATSRPGAADVEFSGAYDANGTLVYQNLPGGLVQRTVVDNAGQPDRYVVLRSRQPP